MFALLSSDLAIVSRDLPFLVFLRQYFNLASQRRIWCKPYMVDFRHLEYTFEATGASEGRLGSAHTKLAGFEEPSVNLVNGSGRQGSSLG